MIGPTFRAVTGDIRNAAASLPIVDAVVTSPPYWQQRKYTGGAVELGQESDPNQFAMNLAAAFGQCEARLAPHGSFWINIGDTRHQMVPHRFAKAMTRRTPMIEEIIWSKPNPNRRKAARSLLSHEYLFVFGRGAAYYDALATATPSDEVGFSTAGSVWNIPVANAKEAHGATFPIELAMKAIACGVSLGGVCSKCAAPRTRHINRERIPTRPGRNHKGNADRAEMGLRDTRRHISRLVAWEWSASCECDAPTRRPIVLDPFIGSGTTAVACAMLGVDCIGVDINPEYVAIAQQRYADTLKPGRKPTAGESRVLDHLRAVGKYEAVQDATDSTHGSSGTDDRGGARGRAERDQVGVPHN